MLFVMIATPYVIIASVVVTRNRLSMLKKAVDSILSQTHKPDKIIIVDNNSSDGTREWLGTLSAHLSNCVPVFLQKNLGGAGGFYHGIKKGCEIGADWIWTIDDDTVADPQALENLVDCGILAENQTGLGFLASRVDWKDGTRHKMNVPGPTTDWTESLAGYPGSVKIRHASFVSILINRRAVEKVGLPIKELFLYHDDVEFTRRITSAGFSAYYICASKVAHLTPENIGITFEQMDGCVQHVTRWKYAIRNLLAVNRRERYGLLRETARLAYITLQLFRARIPMKIRVSLIMAGLEGLGLNYEKWIEHPSVKQTVSNE
jgi:hypothetical protein